ncbi:MAG: hypothetical protein IPG97_17165 [Microthrixaceae bacterium]|nr:hypothetical protein [Microthrixaceae bacterium]
MLAPSGEKSLNLQRRSIALPAGSHGNVAMSGAQRLIVLAVSCRIEHFEGSDVAGSQGTLDKE